MKRAAIAIAAALAAIAIPVGAAHAHNMHGVPSCQGLTVYWGAVLPGHTISGVVDGAPVTIPGVVGTGQHSLTWTPFEDHSYVFESSWGQTIAGDWDRCEEPTTTTVVATTTTEPEVTTSTSSSTSTTEPSSTSTTQPSSTSTQPSTSSPTPAPPTGPAPSAPPPEQSWTPSQGLPATGPSPYAWWIMIGGTAAVLIGLAGWLSSRRREEVG